MAAVNPRRRVSANSRGARTLYTQAQTGEEKHSATTGKSKDDGAWPPWSDTGNRRRFPWFCPFFLLHFTSIPL